MKKSQDIINLPILAINEGDFISRVYAPVINPAEGKLEYLLLEGEQWFLEKNVLNFQDIAAIGDNAVTIEKAAHVKQVSKVENAVKLLKKNVPVLNSLVMTKGGKLIGKITEIYFDETTGQIMSCEMSSIHGDNPAGIIPSAKITTFGPKYLVVEDDAAKSLISGLAEHKAVITPEPAVTGPVENQPSIKKETSAKEEVLAKAEIPADIKEDQEKDPLTLFNEKQRQFIIGKKSSKTIIDANGNIVASEGTVITEDIIERAIRVDKYAELTMFVE